MYRAEITDEAQRDLEHLDKEIAARILKRINWLEENFEQIAPERLSGPFTDL